MKYREFQKLLKENATFSINRRTDLFLETDMIRNEPEATKKGRPVSFRPLVASLAGLLVIILVATVAFLHFDTKAVLTVDINPSFRIEINGFNNVSVIEGLNADGEEVAENMTIRKGKLDKVLDNLYDVSTELGYLDESEAAILVGIDGLRYETELDIKKDIEDIYGEKDMQIAIIQKHTATPSSFYCGYVNNELQEGIQITTTAVLASTTVADGIPNGTTDSFYDEERVFQIPQYTESEFADMAAAYDVTEARLQVAMAVFDFYSDTRQYQDLINYLGMDLQDLLVLYNAIG